MITDRMMAWVDRIKGVGSDANHEIPEISEQSAMDVERFTEQLLRLTFEMKAIMDAAAPD